MQTITARRIIVFSLICPVLLLTSLNSPAKVFAADCADSACIDVYTLNGRLVIEAHKGAKPTITVKATPRPTLSVSRKPTVKPTPKITVRVTPLLPGVSLNDKLTKLLPTGSISKQPSSDVLANVAVIYWCNLPSVFNTKVSIIGEVIDVTMRASFLWSFGDGGFYATTSPGGSYPSQEIMHTYTKPGTYLVTMLATWGGTWTHNGVARAITGQVRKLSVKTIHVVSAPTVVGN